MKELNEIDDFTFTIMKETLFEMVPDFRNFFEVENKHSDLKDGVYLLMYEFSAFLSYELIKHPTSSIVQKSFYYINLLGESNNMKVLNILKIGILEILYSSKNIDREKVNSFLSKKGQKYFIEISKNYY